MGEYGQEQDPKEPQPLMSENRIKTLMLENRIKSLKFFLNACPDRKIKVELVDG